MGLYNVSARWTVKTDKFTLFVYCTFPVLLSTTVCSQNINKQNVNIANETLTDYSFLSKYKELFKKTISNSSLNSHVYWDTLYTNIFLNKIYWSKKAYTRGGKVSKLRLQITALHTESLVEVGSLIQMYWTSSSMTSANCKKTFFSFKESMHWHLCILLWMFFFCIQ